MGEGLIYRGLQERGCSAAEGARYARTQGMALIPCMRLIRGLYNLSLSEAKEALPQADGMTHSLSDEQGQWLPVIKQALDELDSPDIV